MQRPIWKPGPHHVYLAYDKIKLWYKIGMTGYQLEYYRKQLCNRVYGSKSHQKIAIHHSWLFQEFWAAWYVEQTTISLVKRFDFDQMREGDWFSIDELSLEAVWWIIDDLAVEIRKWEAANVGFKCEPPQFTAWERALARMGSMERSRRANAENLPPKFRPRDLFPVEQ